MYVAYLFIISILQIIKILEAILLLSVMVVLHGWLTGVRMVPIYPGSTVMSLAAARDLQILYTFFKVGFFFYFKVKSASFEQASAARKFSNKLFPA